MQRDAAAANSILSPATHTAMKTPALVSLPIATADGDFTARYSATGLAALAFPTGRKPPERKPLPAKVRVWHQPGEMCSYGELAGALGQPGAARAVGGACGANPIPVLVPCHRVLAAHRKLGGFSGGLHWKRRLLAREGF